MARTRAPVPEALSDPEPTKRQRTLTERVSPAFFLLQAVLIRNMAAAKLPTTDIADLLGVDRSYVIRLAQDGVVLTPSNGREQSILALATSDEHSKRIQNLGLRGLTGGETLAITLAGGERPKLGTVEERAKARAERAATAPKPPVPADPKEAKAPRAKKVKEAPPAPEPATATVAPPKERKAKKVKEAPPAPEPAPTKGKRTKGKRTKASKDQPPAPPTDEPTADDILGNL